jgi:signal peptidase I
MIKKAIFRHLLEIAAASTVSTVLFILCFHYFLKPFKVEGMSMEPLLHNGDCILVRRFHSCPCIKRGDVVVVAAPEGGFAVKRVAALEGDKVAIKDGRLFVNNKSEGTIGLGVKTLTGHDAEIKIGKGFAYLLGDNREVSLDSRIWGPVSLDRLYGKTILIDNLKEIGRSANGNPK